MPAGFPRKESPLPTTRRHHHLCLGTPPPLQEMKMMVLFGLVVVVGWPVPGAVVDPGVSGHQGPQVKPAVPEALKQH